MTNPGFIATRPQFTVNGEQRNDMAESLTSMIVNLPLHGCAHAELTLTNWGIPAGESVPSYLFNDISLGAELEVIMEYPQAVTIFKGDLTAIEEQYGNGAPTLSLLLQDKLHLLGRTRRNRSFEDYSPDDILSEIGSELGLETDIQVSTITSTWHQLNESDLAFIMRLLGRFDIAARIDDNTMRARPEEPDPEPVEINGQDNGLKIHLIADLNHQPLSSNAQGYNVAIDESVEHTSSSMIPSPVQTSAKATLETLSWPGEETVPYPSVRSQAEAEAYGAAHFRRMAKRFIHGDIVCSGEPTLRSGKEIELSGVSPRLVGTYQIVHCSHRFDNQNGYETHIKVNKADWSSS